MKNLGLLIFLLFGLLALFVWQVLRTDENSAEEESKAFCAVIDDKPSQGVAYNEHINYDIGKRLFKENCASCHNKNMQEPMLGPALLGAIGRFDKDTLKFQNYLNDPSELVQSDMYLKALWIENGKILKPAFDFDLNQVKSLVEFIERRYVN